MLQPSIRWRALGEQALCIELQISSTSHDDTYIQRCCEALRTRPFCGFVECTPAFDSLSVHFDLMKMLHLSDTHQYVVDYFVNLMKSVPYYYKRNARKIEIPVLYDGIDLPFLCEQASLSRDAWIQAHSVATYNVVCIGFTPGFPYLSGLPTALQAPRRAQPRNRVPARSVAVGGPYCGIYPHATPGGWHLVGKTPLSLFDAQRENPSFLRVGDQVRFVAISAAEFAAMEESAL